MKYGIVSIVGKPNVGKSTLINGIFKKEVVISSSKPQTTRNMIEVTYDDLDGYVIDFIDTPGLHTPKNKLDLFLNSQVKASLKKSDFILFIFDVSRDYDEEDAECLKVLKDFHAENVILVFNKIDLKPEAELARIIEFVKHQFSFNDYIQISANNSSDISKVVEKITSNLKEYEGDDSDLKVMKKDISDKFFISELIRKIIINNFRQEIPYGIAIVIDELKYDETKKMLSIIYSIIVEKESQKPIIIGKGGKMMKNINIILRNELLKIYDCKIFTNSFVKVKRDWRNSVTQMKELGYKK